MTDIAEQMVLKYLEGLHHASKELGTILFTELSGEDRRTAGRLAQARLDQITSYANDQIDNSAVMLAETIVFETLLRVTIEAVKDKQRGSDG